MANRRFANLQDANRFLFDLLFRHQVYLEGVKAGFASTFRAMLVELYGEFAKYMGVVRYDTLDGMTRSELTTFIYRFQQAQSVSYNRYTQELIKLLRLFLGVDAQVSTAIFDAVREHPASQHVSDSSLAPKNLDSLWASITSEIVPASGMTISEMLVSFGQSIQKRVANRINIGWANNEKPRDVLLALIGANDNTFKGGLFATFLNQSDAIVGTGLQHTSSMLQAAIAGEAYRRYQWVSILDSKTTVICRARNGNIYIYSEGPLPPAHYLCRSKAVSLAQGDALHDEPETFFDWAITQPEVFLKDAFGASVAAKFTAHSASAKDISVNDASLPLTVNQFADKIRIISM